LKILIICLSLLYFNSVYSQKNKDDFTYDKDSKSIIPKYLGKVILLKGKAIGQRDGQDVLLKNGTKIYPKDIIKTQAKSLIKIEMVDKTLMTAGPDTTLAFEKWQYKSKEDRKGTFNLIKGKMRAHFKVKAKEENSLKIKVGTVAMGVRGTRILANKYTQISGIQVSHVATLSGKTQIYDELTDITLNQKAGGQYISFLKRDGTLLKSDDRPLSQKEIKYLKSDDKDPMKYFKPFMKEFKGKTITNQDGSGQGSIEYGKSTHKKYKKNKNSSWKKTLNKLNERLEETN
jgi:hypothetical protein